MRYERNVADGDSSSNTATPDLFTGAMSYTIPIKVPPGRKGMEPAVALTYRSANGDSWVGYGWDLEMGAIQRNLKGGIDFDGEKFQLRRAGSLLDLVKTVDGYHVKIENEFLKIERLSGPAGFPQVTPPDGYPYWVITDKAGTRYIYGPTAASRQDDPGITGNPNHPARPASIF